MPAKKKRKRLRKLEPGEDFRAEFTVIQLIAGRRRARDAAREAVEKECDAAGVSQALKLQNPRFGRRCGLDCPLVFPDARARRPREPVQGGAL